MIILSITDLKSTDNHQFQFNPIYDQGRKINILFLNRYFKCPYY